MTPSSRDCGALRPYQPNRSLLARVQRGIVQSVKVQPLERSPERPIISFTFDDFPRSAADAGADIVEGVDGRATFYACSGMAGLNGVCGDYFTPGDLASLVRGGHEIGTHTHAHLDCARSSLDVVARDIEHCETELAAMGLAQTRHFAYPFGETTVQLKRLIKNKVVSARGITAGLNRRGSDRMQLRALELSPQGWTLERAARAIEVAARTNAWAILFTHDVRARPSDYGVQPDALRALARRARDSGAAILPIGQALGEITSDSQS